MQKFYLQPLMLFVEEFTIDYNVRNFMLLVQDFRLKIYIQGIKTWHLYKYYYKMDLNRVYVSFKNITNISFSLSMTLFK